MAEEQDGGANPLPLNMSVIEGNFDFVRHFRRGQWGDTLELSPRHEARPFDAILCNTDEYLGRYELQPVDSHLRESDLPARSCNLLPNMKVLRLRGGDWTGSVWIRLK